MGRFDEGFLVGYSINSKAFRVFNSKTRKVEENMHIKFLENKPNVAGSGLEWLFNKDSLTKSMNYEPNTVGNQTNGDAGIETNVNTGQAGQEKASDNECILLPLMFSNSPLSSSTQSIDDKDADEVLDKGDDDHVQDFRTELDRLLVLQKEGYANNTNRDSTSSPSVSTLRPSINIASKNINTGSPNINTASPIPNDSSMQSLEITGIFDDAYDYREVGAEADLNNLETTMNVSPIPTTRIHKDHPIDQIFGDINLATQTRRMTKIFEEHAMFPDKVYKVEKALYGLHQALRAWYETLSTYLLENGFRRGTIDKTLFIKKDRGDILLVQVYVDDIIFGSTKKSLCDEFEGLMHKRFQMSSMKELTFFLGLQVQQKEDVIFISQDKYVAEILKKSMIGSLMYLAAFRPDITFAVCACARDSSFDLEAFSDSDYAGASIDRKSTTGGCQFVGKRLISWQCKKQTIVANSTTKEEYVAAVNCCGHVFKDGFDGCIGLKMLFGPVLRVKHGKKLVSAARLALCCWAKVSTVRHRVSSARQT
ncbi:putative ribonuclease H-like domain-containing protein [Tanacetum coccineum]